MADYWKSQAKKFCDFCKCWIADNKPSVEFHEKGKRHKENVTQRLKSISKQSRKDFKERQKIDDEMKKMEKAALEAYMKDVQAEADYSSQILKEKLARLAEESEEEDDKSKEAEKKKTKKKTEVKPWCEAVSDEGHTYYWNSETGDSAWEPPECGYMTLAEQKEWEEEEKRKKAKREAEQERKKQEEEKMKNEEFRAFMARERMKSRAAKPEVKEEEDKPSGPIYGPPQKANPYGSWTTVKVTERKPVDLQLPEHKKNEIIVPASAEPKIKFKERTLDSLDSSDAVAECSFKKRKFNSNPKRNMRQKLNDD